jgi:hypothetical protein
MVEKKRSRPHDPQAQRPDLQLGGHVDNQGKPWVYLVLNGNAIPMSVTTAIEVGKAAILHASESASDALLFEYYLSMELATEGITLEEARELAYEKLKGFMNYKLQREEMADQMNKAIAMGTHTPATPEEEEVQA